MGGQATVDGPFPGDEGQRSAPVFAQEDDDFELDEHFAWLVRELDAGRLQPPPESVLDGPAVSLSLGDACDVTRSCWRRCAVLTGWARSPRRCSATWW